MNDVLKTCAIVGNPNVGKSSFFNILTGSNQNVSNWSGVTVSKKTGIFKHQNQKYNVTDLPGLYDFLSSGENCECSIDESITRSFLFENQIDLLINVIDATNIERNLYLTTQLLELGIPMLIIVSKTDVAASRGLHINAEDLSQKLGCPVLLTNFNKKSFKKELITFTADGFSHQASEAFTLRYSQQIESAIEKFPVDEEHSLTHRAKMLSMLGAGQSCRKYAGLESLDLSSDLDDVDIDIATTRYTFAEKVYSVCVTSRNKKTVSERIDAVVLNKFLGLPIFLGVMYLMFMFAIHVGSAFIDFFDIMAGTIFVDYPHYFLQQWGAPAWLETIVADGVGAGIQTVATFIPVIASLFIALSVLEISGYLSRAAFVIDGFMKKLGLPGKAFVPMIVGFGCSIPAIMATRILSKENERIVAGMMAPFMSCGARLPVYALFAAAFFPENSSLLVFGLYIIGILAAIGTGYLLRHTMMPKEQSAHIMELTPYEFPHLKAVCSRVVKRTKSFLTGSSKIIIIVVTVISFVNSIGVDGSFGNSDKESSVLSALSQKVTPIFEPMGIQEDNWPATVGLVTGLFAKEVVVGTLNSLYSPSVDSEDSGAPNLMDSYSEALQSIWDGFGGIAVTDPLGMNVDYAADMQGTADELEIEVSTIHQISMAFGSQIAAFSYLLFILLYTPCVAAVGALKNEFGTKWALFSSAWTLYLAYAVATIVYQAATFMEHPLYSFGWITLLMGGFVGIYRLLKTKKKTPPEMIQVFQM